MRTPRSVVAKRFALQLEDGRWMLGRVASVESHPVEMWASVQFVAEDDGHNIEWITYLGRGANGKPQYRTDRCRWFSWAWFRAHAHRA